MGSSLAWMVPMLMYFALANIYSANSVILLSRILTLSTKNLYHADSLCFNSTRTITERYGNIEGLTSRIFRQSTAIRHFLCEWNLSGSTTQELTYHLKFLAPRDSWRIILQGTTELHLPPDQGYALCPRQCFSILITSLDIKTMKIFGFSDLSFANNRHLTTQLGYIIFLVEGNHRSVPLLSSHTRPAALFDRLWQEILSLSATCLTKP